MFIVHAVGTRVRKRIVDDIREIVAISIFYCLVTHGLIC